MQYLPHRYQRGKDWNDEYMRSHHLYVVNENTPTLSEAHAELLKFQSSQGDGGDSLLDAIFLDGDRCNHHTNKDSVII